MTGPDAPPRRHIGHALVHLPIRALASQVSEDFRESETPAGSSAPMAGSTVPRYEVRSSALQEGHEGVRGVARRITPWADQQGIDRRARRPPDADAPGRTGRSTRRWRRSATAMTLCSDWMAVGLAAKAAGMDMGVMDRRRPVSAIEAEWRKRAAGVVPAQPKVRPEGRHPSFQAHTASVVGAGEYQRESAAVPTALRFSTAAMPMTIPPIPPRILMAMAESIMCLVTP